MHRNLPKFYFENIDYDKLKVRIGNDQEIPQSEEIN